MRQPFAHQNDGQACADDRIWPRFGRILTAYGAIKTLMVFSPCAYVSRGGPALRIQK